MATTYSNISDEALKAATGKTWPQWIAFLNKKGANEMSHKEIAKMLQAGGHVSSGWWAQTVTVGYEYATKRRVKGQTADAGFQVGVQKTLPIEAEKLWEYLLSRRGLSVWLGAGVKKLKLDQGATFLTDEGTAGEMRSFSAGEKLRLTWQPINWENRSTLQLYLLPNCEKTALRFHHEKLDGAKQRAEMKAHWADVLKRIGKELSS